MKGSNSNSDTKIPINLINTETDVISGMHQSGSGAGNQWSHINLSDDIDEEEIKKEALGLTGVPMTGVPYIPGGVREGEGEEIDLFGAKGPLDLPPVNYKDKSECKEPKSEESFIDFLYSGDSEENEMNKEIKEITARLRKAGRIKLANVIEGNLKKKAGFFNSLSDALYYGNYNHAGPVNIEETKSEIDEKQKAYYEQTTSNMLNDVISALHLEGVQGIKIEIDHFLKEFAPNHKDGSGSEGNLRARILADFGNYNVDETSGQFHFTEYSKLKDHQEYISDAVHASDALLRDDHGIQEPTNLSAATTTATPTETTILFDE